MIRTSRFADAVTSSGRKICAMYREVQKCFHMEIYGNCRFMHVDPDGTWAAN